MLDGAAAEAEPRGHRTFVAARRSQEYPDATVIRSGYFEQSHLPKGRRIVI
jgi:hypothetical protein